MVHYIIDFILSNIVKLDSYGSMLESYISSHNPKTIGDVERLEKEYAEKLTRGFIA